MIIGVDKPGRDIATMTDAEIGEAALDAAEAAFRSLVHNQLTCGPRGPGSLHMRVGVSVDEQFVQWAARIISEGSTFAENTGQTGKAGTSAKYLLDSAEAARLYGDVIPKGPGRWTGGVCCEYTLVLENGEDEEFPPGIGSSSGVQGKLDRVPSATAAYTLTGLVVLRYEARLAAGLPV